MKLGAMKIKSTKITKINILKGKVTFHGNGFGHGVGLCQYGAYGMAQAGFSALEIVNAYYPDTNVKEIY